PRLDHGPAATRPNGGPSPRTGRAHRAKREDRIDRTDHRAEWTCRGGWHPMGMDQPDRLTLRIQHLEMRLENYRASRQRAPSAHLHMFDLLIREAEQELRRLRAVAGGAAEAPADVEPACPASNEVPPALDSAGG